MSVNATHFERIPTFPEKQESSTPVVHAIIETPARRRHKYAFEPKFGTFVLKSTLAEGLTWPYDYGFIPQTLAEDGDPLDVLFLGDEPTFPGCLIEARLLGIVHLEKDGKENDRVLACAKPVEGVAQTTDAYRDIKDVPQENIDGICRFLVEYSQEQGHKISFKGVSGKQAALEAIKTASTNFGKDGAS